MTRTVAGVFAILFLSTASYACNGSSSSDASEADTLPTNVPPPSDAPVLPAPIDATPAMDGGLDADAEPGFSPGAVKVCPSGCDYKLPSEAAAAAKNGAVIEILAGSYDDCMTLHADHVTVRGIGGYAHLHTKICDGKGIIVTYGQDTHLERLELSDFANADYNGAGIRHDAAAKDLTVTRVFIHDGQLGLLASSTGDTVTIDSSLFQRVGVSRPDGEISVPLYVTGAKTLTVRSSNFLDGVAGASMIKSRALSTVIACSVIANLDGPDSYSVDLQNGNDLSLTNSVIEQSTTTQNGTMVGYGSSSFNPATAKSFVIKGTTFVNDANGGTFINLFHGAPATFDVSGNTFIGGGTVLAGGGTLATNQQLTARPAALGAYPKLPAPGVCP
jgi:hypothetical protein